MSSDLRFQDQLHVFGRWFCSCCRYLPVYHYYSTRTVLFSTYLSPLATGPLRRRFFVLFAHVLYYLNIATGSAVAIVVIGDLDITLWSILLVLDDGSEQGRELEFKPVLIG